MSDQAMGREAVVAALQHPLNNTCLEAVRRNEQILVHDAALREELNGRDNRIAALRRHLTETLVKNSTLREELAQAQRRIAELEGQLYGTQS